MTTREKKCSFCGGRTFEEERVARKEQLRRDVDAIRAEARRTGGTTSRQVDAAIKRYREHGS